MKAYKLLRKLSDGNLYPLFIHKTYSTPIGEWMKAECYPTKGFAIRKRVALLFSPYSTSSFNAACKWGTENMV